MNRPQLNDFKILLDYDITPGLPSSFNTYNTVVHMLVFIDNTTTHTSHACTSLSHTLHRKHRKFKFEEREIDRERVS